MIFIMSIITAGIIQWNCDKLPLGVYVSGLLLCGMGMAGGESW